ADGRVASLGGDERVDPGDELPGAGTGEGAGPGGVEVEEHARLEVDEPADDRMDAGADGPGLPVLGVGLDLDGEHARDQRGVEAVGPGAVGDAVAGGHD